MATTGELTGNTTLSLEHGRRAKFQLLGLPKSVFLVHRLYVPSEQPSKHNITNDNESDM